MNSLQQQSSSHEITWSGWHRSTQSKKKIHLHLQHYTFGNNNKNTAADVIELHLHWIFCNREEVGGGKVLLLIIGSREETRTDGEEAREIFVFWIVFLFVHCAVVVYVFRYRPLLLFSGAELWPALAAVLSLSLSVAKHWISDNLCGTQIYANVWFLHLLLEQHLPIWKKVQKKTCCCEQQQAQLRTVSANFIFSFAGLGPSLLFYVVIWLLWSSSMPELRVLCRICSSTIISSLRNKDKQEIWKEKFVD